MGAVSGKKNHFIRETLCPQSPDTASVKSGKYSITFAHSGKQTPTSHRGNISKTRIHLFRFAPNLLPRTTRNAESGGHGKGLVRLVNIIFFKQSEKDEIVDTMSSDPRRPTSEEKDAIREICMLRQRHDDLKKAIDTQKRPLLDKKKEAKDVMTSMLSEDSPCVTIGEKKYLRFSTQNSMRAIKMDMVKNTILSLTRDDVMASTDPKDTDVWDTLCKLVKKKINDERRVQKNVVGLSKTKPRGVESVACTDEVLAAVDAYEKANHDVLRFSCDQLDEFKQVKSGMAEKEKVIGSYMKRANKSSQKIHIGVVENIERTFVLKRKRKNIKITMPELLTFLREAVGSYQSLEQFEQAKEIVFDAIVGRLEQSQEEDTISLVRSGLREK